MLSPSAKAISNGFKSSVAPPSARTYPSAEASKARQRPLTDNMEALEKPIKAYGCNKRFTAPTKAMDDSPDRKLLQAWCKATNDEEQAVSTATEGPRKSKVLDSRLAAMLSVLPVIEWAVMLERSSIACKP